jgi:flavin-dependent dehydrogenase
MPDSPALPESCDVLIVGGGATGAAAAYHFARAGRRVVLVERRERERAGARWNVDIPPELFDRAGIDRPAFPELRGPHTMFTMLARDGTKRVRFPNPMDAVDGPALVRRLWGLAEAAGAVCVDRANLVDLECSGFGRPAAAVVEVRGPVAATRRVKARLFVDAGGSAGPLRRRVPPLASACPSPEGRDVCNAVQQVHEVRDRDGARRFLEGLGATTGDFLVWTGVSGAFSTRLIHVHEGMETVDVLAGALEDGEHALGPALLDAFLADHPWIGPKRWGGGERIPMRRPYDRIASPGVALLGEAGCQVFPANGCGVGIGLVAARLLAETAAPSDDPGAPGITAAYAARFQRGIGGLHAAYDVFRRATAALTEDEVARLLDVGLLTAGSVSSATHQHLPVLGPLDLLSAGVGALREPALASRFAGSVARMFAILPVYRMYPETHDEAALRRWAWTAAQIGGWTADPV